jgi:hypothetical protein
MKKQETKICVICKNEFHRTVYESGNIENITKYRARVVCGRSCKHDYTRLQKQNMTEDYFVRAKNRIKNFYIDGWLAGAI